MKRPPSTNTAVSLEKKASPDAGVVIRIQGRMDYRASSQLIHDIRKKIDGPHPGMLTVDLGDVTYFDDYGALVVDEISRLCTRHGTEIRISDPNRVSEAAVTMPQNGGPETSPSGTSQTHEGVVEKIGESALAHFDSLKGMVSFLGSVFIAFCNIVSHPRALRGGDTLAVMEKTGVNALPIVAMISFLLGLVIAFMSSLQLRQFGANIYVASLVAIGMVSELGPIMTAIVVSGRSGSAFAAEIGTMKISEEIDALATMGFDPVVFLALPRMIAAMVVVPILTLLSNIFAILGGMTVGVFLLDLTLTSYLSQSLDSLTLFEIFWGLMKSFVFAVLISWVGCLRGFQAKGGADAVGNAATSAVVSGVFLIILFDSFFAVLRSYWW